MSALDRYADNLAHPVKPGAGCHGWLMSTANLGIIAGKDPQTIHEDIRRTILPGKRKVSDGEIADAINKALSDHNGGTFTPRPRPAPAVKDGTAARQWIIDQGKIRTEVDLWEASPIRIDWLPVEDVQHAL